ncbi:MULTISPECIES: hypothetical protein [unclassified Chryseobacterium]|uniref:hypothetical protein n=1 Tax=unclassified Chryseobacterium TaxID=2593645 RepID=UPI00100B30FA|nr:MULTISPECIES: hypothetical protein [unclassified Chryseobacterium]RXM52562.1 hypothetical protein BOQ64_06785 [Chryseobacterium sp. CH25]RXM66618.1 hypothetical protein BOQ60_01260 [Chryseobacterium sp. CH1]
MKKVIITDLIIVALVYIYYPVFDSETISYFIIFLCFAILCFSVAKIYTSNDKENYESVEKEMNQRYADDGIFQYINNGFYVKQERTIEWIEWNQIITVYSFSIPILNTARQTGIEIITDENSYEFTYENTPGIDKLIDQLIKHLPSWKYDSPTIRNNAGAKKTLLYQRKNIQ